MENKIKGNRHVITPDMLEDLPSPVQRYLTYTGVVGYPWIDTIRLEQRGKFRQGSDRPWMSLTAEEYYTTDPPSLEWNARFKIAGLPLLRARDKYESGHGHMFGQLAGIFTIFDIIDERLDQGAMLRYLSEIFWFPTAFLGTNIKWEEVDADSANVIFTDHGKTVTARMHFDDAGRPTNFTALRYREMGGEFSLDPWSTPLLSYGEWAGLNIPTRGQAVWNLESGDLLYADLEITEIEYNYST